jgi:hypothetical protein
MFKNFRKKDYIMLKNETIPRDPMILLSFINTKLRDQYNSLESLCDDMELDENDLKNILKAIDYSYNQELNKFV